MEGENFKKQSERELAETIRRIRRQEERANKVRQKLMKIRQASINDAD